MKRSSSLVLLAVVGIGCLSFRKAPPDLSSPKATVKSFVAAIKDGDVTAAAACIKNGKEIAEVKNLFSEMDRSAFQITDVLAEVDGDSAKVAVEYRSPPKNPALSSQPVFLVDILSVEKSGIGWQIVVTPGSLEKFMENPETQQVQVIKLLTILVGDPKGIDILKQARLRAQAASSLSNVKQIGTATLMYVQDYDEIYPTPASKFKDLVYPYIKSEQTFHAPAAPADEKVSYSFNRNLQGISMAAVSVPANTVVIYEGKSSKPEYRYEGKTVIGFADGHAKLCSPEEVSKFVWMEKGWKPAPPPKPTAPKSVPKKKPTQKR